MRTVKKKLCKDGEYDLASADTGVLLQCSFRAYVCSSACAAFQCNKGLPGQIETTYHCNAMRDTFCIGEEVPEVEKPDPACVALVNEDGSLIGERAPVIADEQSGEPWQWIRDLSESVKRLLYKELEKRRRVIADDQEAKDNQGKVTRVPKGKMASHVVVDEDGDVVDDEPIKVTTTSSERSQCDTCLRGDNAEKVCSLRAAIVQDCPKWEAIHVYYERCIELFQSEWNQELNACGGFSKGYAAGRKDSGEPESAKDMADVIHDINNIRQRVSLGGMSKLGAYVAIAKLMENYNTKVMAKVAEAK